MCHTRQYSTLAAARGIIAGVGEDLRVNACRSTTGRRGGIWQCSGEEDVSEAIANIFYN